MRFEDLISVLVAEHGKMKNGFAEVREAVSRKDYFTASKILRDLDLLFRQHIADEEAQVLRLLIDAYGVEGAQDAIKVFQQHRPIYDLMEKVKKLAVLPVEELVSNQDQLTRLFQEHAFAEENSVFPSAVSVYRERQDRAGTAD